MSIRLFTKQRKYHRAQLLSFTFLPLPWPPTRPAADGPRPQCLLNCYGKADWACTPMTVRYVRTSLIVPHSKVESDRVFLLVSKIDTVIALLRVDQGELCCPADRKGDLKAKLRLTKLCTLGGSLMESKKTATIDKKVYAHTSS